MSKWRRAGGVWRKTIGMRVCGGGKHAECASHLIEPRSALSPPSSPSVRLVLRLAGETARRRCVDVSGYSQQPRLIVCDSCPC